MIEVINKSGRPLPTYATSGSAGMDICASLSVDVILEPLERIAIPTGLYIAIPEGMEVQIRPRSGLALNKGLTVVNAPGTIDSDYRGELKILIINLSREPQAISDGDRIAQMVLSEVKPIQWREVNQLDDTVRGDGGLGSTGL